MEFRCQCECGKRFRKTIENPTDAQVAYEMYVGFIYEKCEVHENKTD